MEALEESVRLRQSQITCLDALRKEIEMSVICKAQEALHLAKKIQKRENFMRVWSETKEMVYLKGMQTVKQVKGIVTFKK